MVPHIEILGRPNRREALASLANFSICFPSTNEACRAMGYSYSVDVHLVCMQRFVKVNATADAVHLTEVDPGTLEDASTGLRDACSMEVGSTA